MTIFLTPLLKNHFTFKENNVIIIEKLILRGDVL